MAIADDERAIREVLERVAIAQDRQDWELLATCYTTDATGLFGGGDELTSPTEIVDYARIRLQRFTSTMHHMTNTRFDIRGDEATTESYALAFLVRDSPDGQQVLMRGLRYIDEFVCRGNHWSIRRRQHLPQWMVILPAAGEGDAISQ